MKYFSAPSVRKFFSHFKHQRGSAVNTLKSALTAAFLTAAVCALTAGCASAAVEQNTDAHEVIGGLLSAASLANVFEAEHKAAPDSAQQLAAYGIGALADTVQIKKNGGSLWVGVPVGRTSRARGFIRTHAPEMGLFDAPDGGEWMSGEFVWFRASKKGDAPRSVMSAAHGAGSDAGMLFISAAGSGYWWLAPSSLSGEARRKIMELFGTDDAPALRAPSAENAGSEFRSAPMDLPPDMHVGSGGSDDGIEMGDVIFNPIPRGTNSN